MVPPTKKGKEFLKVKPLEAKFLIPSTSKKIGIIALLNLSLLGN